MCLGSVDDKPDKMSWYKCRDIWCMGLVYGSLCLSQIGRKPQIPTKFCFRLFTGILIRLEMIIQYGDQSQHGEFTQEMDIKGPSNPHLGGP